MVETLAAGGFSSVETAAWEVPLYYCAPLLVITRLITVL
jgi:hypothetical protein